MRTLLELMEQNLTEEDKILLDDIYAPQVVAVPPADACRNMCITPDGEIRIYGGMHLENPEAPSTLTYIASRDCGLSWKQHLVDPDALGAAAWNPETGRYISTYPNEWRPELNRRFGKPGTWAILNDQGFDCTENRWVQLSEENVHILRHPWYLESCKRWLILAQEHITGPDPIHIHVFFSDDDGESWQETVLEQFAPKHEMTPPHKGVRWQQYSCEPSIVELSTGELVMMVRTSQDYHYMYRSADHGTSWIGPERTDFHSTITMPVLQKLSDGRILFFWCNTQPLPEIDKTTVFPGLTDDEIAGVWEDVFTNRDANHLAISEDDMQTWKGFRELYLNGIRNRADFRSTGDYSSRDKSVHQGQILELPRNKVLVHFGQNSSSRKLMILDLNWLYEQERSEDFFNGMEGISTQMYVASNLGGDRGFKGHCAYNRTNGALMMPDPEGNFKEVLQVARTDDPRLVYQKQGVVWNFPASSAGRVQVELQVVGSGVNLSLTDHWYNPCDETVLSEAAFTFPVEKTSGWITVHICYDTLAQKAKVTLGDRQFTLPMQAAAPNGISYLHIQTLAEQADYEGTLIRSLRKTVL